MAVALAGALVVLLGWFQIGNLDLGYHIAYGRHFLETGEIVGFEPDPFLYASTREAFVNANWGSQAILAIVEGAAGATGLFALRLGLIGVLFASIGHVAFRQTARPWAVAMAWILAGLAGYERFSLRPELFSYAILSVQLVVLVGGVNAWWRVAALVGLQLLLVNLHSYFLLGVALTLCWAVEAIGRGLLRGWSASLYDRNTTANAKFILVALGLQIIACCCHPWHVHAAIFPFQTVRYLAQTDAMGGAGAAEGTGSWSNISEFQSPFSFWGEPINRFTIDAFVLVLVVAILGVAAALRRGRWAYVLAIAGFFIVATQMRRNIAPFAFVATPLAVIAIANAFRRDAAAPGVGRSRFRWARPATGIALIVVSLSLLYVVGTGRWYYWERRITRQRGAGYSVVTFPQDALAWINRQEHLTPELYVDYFASSNALLWLPDRFKLFVDTNTFAYADTTLSEAFKLGLGETPHQRFFDCEKVNVVMLHCGPDTQLLVRNLTRDDMDWALVYFDKSVVIFVRRGVWAHADVVLANPVGPTTLDAEAWIASARGSACERALQMGTMANVPISLGWWRQGAALCEAAVALAPDYHEAWLQWGTCRGNLGNAAARDGDLRLAIDEWEAAVACFRRVLELDAGNASAEAFLKRTQEQLEMARKMERG